jgi:hypothetical protein
LELGEDRVVYRHAPVRVRQESRNRIGEIDQRKQNQNAFYRFVGAAHDDEPDHYGPNRHGNVLADTEDRHPGSQACELGYDVAEIGDPQNKHCEEGRAQAKFLPDQVGEPLARGRAHSGGHLLNHDQSNRSRYQGPEQSVAELRSGLRIRQDAARIVVHVGGNETRPHHRQEDQSPRSD